MENISIIIPVYNESENIINLLDEIKNELINNINYEIIIVNDCSTDNIIQILDQLKISKLKIINHEKNLGQSSSILSGIRNSLYNNIVTIDGDGQNLPSDIMKICKVFFENKDISLVGGLRNKRKDSIIKIISSRIANYIRQKILRDNCSDTGCSLKIFDKKIFLSFPFFDGLHRFLPAFFYGYGFKTMFIPVNHRPRINGVSKYGTFGRLLRGIRDLIRVKIIMIKIKKNDN
jgi:dolichol-phosphate mannosyltransferase